MVLDFDGAISLIREGWQQIMTSYFTDELCNTPMGKEMPRAELELRARESITLLTGKQTIYQRIQRGFCGQNPKDSSKNWKAVAHLPLESATSPPKRLF